MTQQEIITEVRNIQTELTSLETALKAIKVTSEVTQEEAQRYQAMFEQSRIYTNRIRILQDLLSIASLLERYPSLAEATEA